MSAGNRAILLVEDDPELSQALSETLVASGFAVISAARFSDAMIKTNNQRFACILMDLELEKGSGLNVIQQIRNETVNKNLNHETPIILMSGRLAVEVIKEAAGMVQAVMAKPFSTESILSKITALTSQRKPRNL